jgi:hypothetical protein
MCIQICEQTCANGGQCYQLGRTLYACLCGDDSDCLPNQECNRSVGQSFGFGACTTKDPNLPSCPVNTSCRPTSSSGSACLPTQGKQRIGEICTPTLRCETNLNCVSFTNEQPNPVCMQYCPNGASCDGNGRCVQFRGGFAACLCQGDSECPTGNACERLFTGSDGTVYGYCTRKVGAPCQKDTDCPAEYRCENNACVFDPTKKNAPPAAAEEPAVEVTPEETAPEIVEESAPEATPEEVNAPDAAEATPEAPAEAAIEASVEKTPEGALSGGCGCNQQGTMTPDVWWLCALLLLLGLRRRREDRI